ncbi:EGF-like domain-containing protein 2 [Physella acuta]|uniref:EGF-like domain-containing protein 2 n=1 Tax=Physella acuta TaxID=109671 RepID=UPI0027DBCD55|nr:EGF-like domain-containing protein 2 [Physella acuta]
MPTNQHRVFSRSVLVIAFLAGTWCLLQDISAAADEAILKFDCRRRGAICSENKLCHQENGTCDCREEDFSFQCEKFFPTCQSCSPHGYCRLNPTIFPCVCDEGFYGDRCHLPRVQVSCKVDSMYVIINPYGEFHGDIFIFNRSSESSCKFSPINASEQSDILEAYQFQNISDIRGYGIEINHTSSECGSATKLATADEDTVNVSRQFFISYLKNIADATDQIINVSCSVPNDTSLEVGSYLEVDNKLSSEVNVLDIEESASSKVTLTVVYSNGSVIDPQKEIQLGTTIKLKFTLHSDAHSVYKNFTIDKCVADNNETDPSKKKFTNIIDKSCEVWDVRALFYENFSPPKLTENTATLSLKAFMFLDDQTDGRFGLVRFTCTVLLCELVCPQVSCGTNLARRKRATEREEQVSALIKVIDPVAQVKELKSELSAPDCLKQPDMIAVIATLGGLILILIIICIIIVSRLMKSGKKVQDNNFAMHIPRTYLNSAYKLN